MHLRALIDLPLELQHTLDSQLIRTTAQANGLAKAWRREGEDLLRERPIYYGLKWVAELNLGLR
jgi:hypothetical protein